MRGKVSTLIASRASLLQSLATLAPLGLAKSVGGNDANFVMVPVLNRATGEPDNERSQKVYKALAEEEGVVVRFRGGEFGCTGCLRITIGSEDENRVVLGKLRDVLQKL